MVITVDFTGQTPIYAQLRDQIVAGIAGKALRPGETLPSVRRLAADIGAHAHTVNKAYTMLRDEGYIEIDRRSGCYVSQALPPADERFDTALRERLLPLAAAAAAHGMRAEEFQALCGKIYEQCTMHNAQCTIGEPA